MEAKVLSQKLTWTKNSNGGFSVTPFYTAELAIIYFVERFGDLWAATKATNGALQFIGSAKTQLEAEELCRNDWNIFAINAELFMQKLHKIERNIGLAVATLQDLI
jgi:hypothetical protein